MHKTLFLIKQVLLIIIGLFILYPVCEVKALNKGTIYEKDLIGTWKGKGKIIVAWCEQKQLSFDLQIDTNGNEKNLWMQYK